MRYVFFVVTVLALLLSCKETVVTFKTDENTIEEKSFALSKDYLPYITQVHSDGKTFACEAYKPLQQKKDGTEQTIVARYLITEKKVYGPYDDIKLVQISPYDGDVVFAAQPVGDKAYYIYSAQGKKGPFTDIKLLITSPYDTTAVFVIKENENYYVMWNSIKKGPFQNVEHLAFLPCGTSIPIFQTSKKHSEDKTEYTVFSGEDKHVLESNPSDGNWNKSNNKYLKTAIFTYTKNNYDTLLFDPNFPSKYGSPKEVFITNNGLDYTAVSYIQGSYQIVSKASNSFKESELFQTIPYVNYFDNGKMFYTYKSNDSKKAQYLVFDEKTYGPFDNIEIKNDYNNNKRFCYTLAYKKTNTYFFNGSIMKILKGQVTHLSFDKQNNITEYSTYIKEGTFIPFKTVKKQYTIVNNKKYPDDSTIIYHNHGSNKPIIVYKNKKDERFIFLRGEKIKFENSFNNIIFSPDSNSIAYSTNDSSGSYVHVNDEKIGPFKSIRNFGFSPDSSSFFYTVEIENKYYVYTGAKVIGPYKYIEHVWFEKNSNLPTVIGRTIKDKYELVRPDGTTREGSNIYNSKSTIIVGVDNIYQLLFLDTKTKEYPGYIHVESSYPDYKIVAYSASDLMQATPEQTAKVPFAKIMIQGKEYIGMMAQSAVVYIDGETLHIKDLSSFPSAE